MKMLVSDTEVDIEAEGDAVLELVWQGNRLHIKLVRGEPSVPPFRDRDLSTNTTIARKFDGVTPEMEQK